MNASQGAGRSKLRIKPLVACLTLSLAVADIACPTIATAATLQVTNCNDAGSGSLRAVLASARDGDSVDLSALTCGRISLATGELRIDVDNLALHGPGASALTIAGRAEGHQYSVLHHTGHGTVRIDALRITDGHANFADRVTRCVYSSGTVYLNRSIVTECSTGGVAANGFSARDSTISYSYAGVQTTGGSVAINSSTISGNVSYSGCVALRAGSRATPSTATVLISNSTISGNAAWLYWTGYSTNVSCIYQPAHISNSTFAFNDASSMAALYISAPTATIDSSIFAHNSAGDLSMPSGTQVTGHNNVIMNTANTVPADTLRVDPLLLPLADNGGPTWTHALAAGSPAIDAGNNLAELATDQRGSPFTRVAGSKADIGAFELQAPPVTTGAIGPGFTGSWFDAAQSGHGLMLEVLSDHRLLAMWFAFNPEGTQQSWFGGVGTYSGNTATISDVALPVGGRWIPNFNPNSIVRKPWGTLTITFADCNHGLVEFSSLLGYGSDSMDLLRLTQPAGLTCP